MLGISNTGKLTLQQVMEQHMNVVAVGHETDM
jgi:hypothetical protein